MQCRESYPGEPQAVNRKHLGGTPKSDGRMSARLMRPSSLQAIADCSRVLWFRV